MNEKNEQDIFKDLIDSIHVEDNADLERQEPVQVPIQRSNPPEAANQVQKDAPSDPLKNVQIPKKFRCGVLIVWTKRNYPDG